MSSTGWIAMVGCVGIGFGIICADMEEDAIIAGGVMMAGGIVGGTYLQILSRIKVKRLAKQYNDYQRTTSQLSSSTCQLGITMNRGIGLRLTF